MNLKPILSVCLVLSLGLFSCKDSAKPGRFCAAMEQVDSSLTLRELYGYKELSQTKDIYVIFDLLGNEVAPIKPLLGYIHPDEYFIRYSLAYCSQARFKKFLREIYNTGETVHRKEAVEEETLELMNTMLRYALPTLPELRADELSDEYWFSYKYDPKNKARYLEFFVLCLKEDMVLILARRIPVDWMRLFLSEEEKEQLIKKAKPLAYPPRMKK